MGKFKVGDRVRSENTGYESMREMTEGLIVETPDYGDGDSLYRVKVISGIFRDKSSKETFTNASSWSFTEEELEPLSFKVGDEVECEGGYTFDPCVGNIVKINHRYSGYKVKITEAVDDSYRGKN
jgi:hypothetical protein